MIKVKVPASGSKGNCTALTLNRATILLDVGIDFGRLQQALNFENPAAVLVTHEHQDHANKSTLAEFLKRGVEVYMTRGTAEALKLEPRHNLRLLKAGDKVSIADLDFFPLPAKHDAAEPVFFCAQGTNDSFEYITDTGEMAGLLKFLPSHLIIEANHDTSQLHYADIDEHQKQRILNNHLSIAKAAKYIDNGCKDHLQEVHLIHISKRHGDGEQFRQIIQNIVGDKVKVFAH